MAPIVIQFPNCCPEEVPMEEGFLYKVKGLSIDGTIDPDFNVSVMWHTFAKG